MFAQSLICLLAVASTATATVHNRGSCGSDACLKAVGVAGEQAYADCSSLLGVTSTSFYTVTAYATSIETDVVVISTTLVETLHTTATSVDHETATVQTTATVTAAAQAKRAVSAALPTYASACSSIERYLSACSFLSGFTNPSSVISAPVTTVTETVTQTSLTSSTETVSTSSVTVVDSTVTQTTTDAMTTSVTYTTVSPTPTVVSGKLSFLLNGVTTYASIYDSGSLSYVTTTTDASSAATFTMDSNGELWYGDRVAKAPTDTSTLQLFLVSPTLSTTRAALICSLDSSKSLSCYTTGTSIPRVFAYRTNGYVYTGLSSAFVGGTLYTKLAVKLT